MESNLQSTKIETLVHIAKVGHRMDRAIKNLLTRAAEHDASKLESPELEAFATVGVKLKDLSFGTPEYDKSKEELGEALQHHYQNNSHHPEYYENGIDGMSLLDLVEMICDWSAATLRHADGDIYRSIEINSEKFGISEQLKNIIKNTVKELSLDNNENKSTTSG